MTKTLEGRMKGDIVSWEFDETRPLFQQIVEAITKDIVSGRYEPGDKIPSVREFAIEAGVNPNTMQKALSALEDSGLIVTMRNSGRRVTDDTSLIAKVRRRSAVSAAESYIQFAKASGLSLEEAIEILKEVGKDGEHNL